jgi:hypothetical protein
MKIGQAIFQGLWELPCETPDLGVSADARTHPPIRCI